MFGGSLTLLMVSLAMVWFVRHGHLHIVAEPKKAGPAAITPEQAAPWGIVEAIEVPLANPDGSFPDQEERMRSPKWVFADFTEARLTRFLSSCDLRPAEKRVLLDKRSWNIGTNAVTITPPEQIVWTLTHKARQQIYSVLGKSSQNYSQSFPFRFSIGGFEDKFKNSGLSVEQLERVRRLTYTNAGLICFADLQAVRQALSPEDFKDLVETLYAVPTYLLRLKVPPDADVDALIKYWGKGGREKLVAPILTSLSRMPGGGALNVSYFLPPFARLRLYTYPEAWRDPTAARQDCFFTAMNFFNEVPDTNFFDSTFSQHVLQSEYEPINEDPVFGDVVAVFKPSGEAVHTCVYLADDFVFTKNGINPNQPWVIMRMPDMLMIYFAPANSGQLMYLRRKEKT
jgi:hypothetical protein